jgi:hypothetical protein
MKGMASAPVESFTVTVQDGLKTQFTAGALTSTTVSFPPARLAPQG